MKKNKRMKKLRLIPMALAAAVLWSSCGSSGSSTSYNKSEAAVASSFAYASDDYYTEETADMMEAGYGGEVDLSADLHPDENRKVIYTSDVSIETEQFEESVSTIRALLDETGGYVSSTSQWGSSSDGSRRGDYTCRVPAEHYRAFLSGLQGAGNVYSLNEYTDDITTQYVDVQARLDSLQNQKERLEELAKEAEDIDTLLSIEDKLGEVQYQLESYTAQMRTFDNQVDYSTVVISLREVGKVSEGVTFGSRIRAAFSGSWENFVDRAQSFVIWLIYALPGLIILAIILCIAIPLIRRYRKRRRGSMSVQTGKEKQYSAQWQTAAPKNAEPSESKPEDKTE